jgi:glycosyltransferase involved in cell wall biosynthesis
LYPAYLNEFGSRLQRLALAPLSTALRSWDYSTAARVDGFMANSKNVRQRVWKTYRRNSRVVYPPVDVDRFRYRDSEDYFLMVSELVPYKQLDYAIKLFAATGRRLKVVGDGPDYARLRKLGSGNVEFCGRVPDAELAQLYSRCCAFVMPGEEDFGITMVEALASGKPLIALGRGGALEIVREGCGFLYAEPNANALRCALERYDRAQQDIIPRLLQAHAGRFSDSRFQVRFRAALSAMWKEAAPPPLKSVRTRPQAIPISES